MSDFSHSSDEEIRDIHVKKHDHSVLGKHTKEDKQKCCEKLGDSSDNGEFDKKHVKKHDHSVMGKHTKEEKQRYLEAHKLKKEDKEDGHVKKDDHSFLGKHTKEEKRRYLEELKKKKQAHMQVESNQIPAEKRTRRETPGNLAKQTKNDKEKYLDSLLDKYSDYREDFIEESSDDIQREECRKEPQMPVHPVKQKTVRRRRRRRLL